MATISTTPGSPVVMGLTPYSLTKALVPGVGGDWPPFMDVERLEAYGQFDALIENRPADVFADLQLAPDQASKIVLALALPELLCNVWADAVWSEDQAVDVVFEDDAVTEKWDALTEANDLPTLGWESVFSAAARGTSVIQIKRSESNLDSLGTEIAFEPIVPSIYFPKLRKGSARIVDAVVLAWEEDRGDKKPWEVMETHTVESAQYVIRYFEREKGATAFRKAKPDLAPIDVDFLPFVDFHAKRWDGRFWGVSEIGRNLSLFDEIDNTLSNIAEILEYHGKPVLQVPASVVFAGNLFKGADKAIGIRNSEEADIARYITYNGQLDAQLQSLDKNIELALLVAEVPRSYFGDTDGGAPSGTSMRLRLQNYLKKAGRYRRTEDRRLRALADMALRLDDASSATGAGISDRSARIPESITFGSPLPADEVQDATIEEGLVTAGLSSRRTSITRLRRVDDVDEELAEIDKDRAGEATTGLGGFTAPGVDPNTGRLVDTTVGLPGGAPLV